MPPARAHRRRSASLTSGGHHEAHSVAAPGAGALHPRDAAPTRRKASRTARHPPALWRLVDARQTAPSEHRLMWLALGVHEHFYQLMPSVSDVTLGVLLAWLRWRSPWRV